MRKYVMSDIRPYLSSEVKLAMVQDLGISPLDNLRDEVEKHIRYTYKLELEKFPDFASFGESFRRFSGMHQRDSAPFLFNLTSIFRYVDRSFLQEHKNVVPTLYDEWCDSVLGLSRNSYATISVEGDPFVLNSIVREIIDSPQFKNILLDELVKIENSIKEINGKLRELDKIINSDLFMVDVAPLFGERFKYVVCQTLGKDPFKEEEETIANEAYNVAKYAEERYPTYGNDVLSVAMNRSKALSI